MSLGQKFILSQNNICKQIIGVFIVPLFKPKTMRKLLFCLFIASFCNCISQDSCVVKIFPSDCLNCYIGIKKIEFSDENIKKTIVFPSMTNAEINAYINDILNISDINSFDIIVSDSIYNSMNNALTSEVYLYKEEKLYEHSLLKKFYGFTELWPKVIKIPDSIPFSQSTTLINSEDYFFITDSKFAKYVFISKHGNNKISVLTASDLTTEKNFHAISKDTMCYYLFSKHRNILEEVNIDVMRLNHSFTKNSMASFIMAPDIIEDSNEVGLSYKPGIIIFNNNKDYSILSIHEESIPENYAFSPGFYYEYKNDYYIQMMHFDKTMDDQYLLGKFSLKDGNLSFSRFTDYKLPSEYLPASKFKSWKKILSPVGPYIFLQFSLSYYNLDNDQTYKLPLDSVKLEFRMPGLNRNSMKIEYNYMFIDAHISKNTLKVLYKEIDKYYIAFIDRISNTLIEKKEITNIPKDLKAGLSFYSEDKILFLTKDNSIVIEKIDLN